MTRGMSSRMPVPVSLRYPPNLLRTVMMTGKRMDLDEGEDKYDEGDVYDDEYDSDEYYDPDDDEEDTEDQEEGPTMS